MANYERLPLGSHVPESFNGVVEIPGGTRNKVQYDERLGVFRLDRTLFSPMEYPFEYGFLPSTLAGDGDPLDLLILMTEPTFPGCVVEVRPVAKLGFRDEEGEDAKILSVPVGDPRFRGVHDVDSVLPHTLREIEEFFRTYGVLEHKRRVLKGWSGRAEALKEIERGRHRYARKHGSRAG